MFIFVMRITHRLLGDNLIVKERIWFTMTQPMTARSSDENCKQTGGCYTTVTAEEQNRLPTGRQEDYTIRGTDKLCHITVQLNTPIPHTYIIYSTT